MTEAPLRHLSIRVPWHDNGWNGTVCLAPHLNGACTRLPRIAEQKRVEFELPVAGRSLQELPEGQWPCCVAERAGFMAPFETAHVKEHALARSSPRHYGHFRPTRQRYPAYAAGVVPFRWMMLGNLDYYRDLYQLDVDVSREPDLGYRSNWVHEVTNQSELLDGFANSLRSEDSLCLFYAKHVPFVEGSGRILIAVGRVAQLGPLSEYDRVGQGMRGMIWERPVQHTIRPDGRDGFLFPYSELLRRAEDDPALDLERFAPKVPDDHWEEFSYASELVSHDGAIGALLSLDSSLEKLQDELGIATVWQRQWIHEHLIQLWKVRGPFPGLGAVLAAFGLSRGVFVAHALQEAAGVNGDPWPLVDVAFRSPAEVLPAPLRKDLSQLARVWLNLPAERRSYLRLLSRFELSLVQAESFYDAGARARLGCLAPDQEFLANPYRLYEISRTHPQVGLRLLTVDRGVFPDDAVRLVHPLEEPSGLDSALDERRVRAFATAALEEAATQGHCLLSPGQLTEAIQRFPAQPPCRVTGDILSATDLAPEIEAAEESMLQLQRYRKIQALVRKEVLGRLTGARLTLATDWKALLDRKFGAEADTREAEARAEKIAALGEISQARVSVLVGPAGSGKTTVLGLLCAQPEILNDGILLLAPTGKARVRMQVLAGGSEAKALTVAQFLNQCGRYDGATGRYFMSERPKVKGYATVIVDESSMLTEDMLGALLDGLSGVKRYIFVGDPGQLPPIGAGRPFVDIVTRLRPDNADLIFPRVGLGYAELTIERRQSGDERSDLRLARWFSHAAPSPGEDDVFSLEGDSHLRFVAWDKPEDFHSALLAVLREELGLQGEDDVGGFNLSLGAVASGNYQYFNREPAVHHVEAWQILSPLRGMPFGVSDINRQIHERFRSSILELAHGNNRPIPKPLGAERIVYGDKVINLSNHRRDHCWPKEGLAYLANGEIGICVGRTAFKRTDKKNPDLLKVAFSSQPDFTYDFFPREFTEEGLALLELAYALTVHKAQGSQFTLVILVLPQAHPILSRELVYTALTRHEARVVVMHQGPRSGLKDLADPHRSETARRMTNLLQPVSMVEILQPKGSLFLQEGLVHRTSRGLAVRSKSELIIAEALNHAGVDFSYEKPLAFGNVVRYPDFTLENDIAGAVYYWEHLGMLDREHYRRKWDSKLAWYRANGILPADEGGGPNGSLLVTTESPTAGFDAGLVKSLIETYF